jgi:hypothetical protein
MDLENLIPFGQVIGTDEFADVGDVAKGRACGCICPSCQTPLVARQGAVKAWHFAHASRGAYAQTSRDCGYSFEVSARLMALQLLRQGIALQLPACHGTIDDFDLNVAAAQLTALHDVKVETGFSGIVVDAVATVNGAPFVVYLTHSARALPAVLKTPDEPRASIVSIDVGCLRKVFADAHGSDKRYTEILRQFLELDQPSKIWVFHPDLPRKRALALEQQTAQQFAREARGEPYGSQRSVYSAPPTSTPSKGPRSFCISCHAEWPTPTTGHNRCPRCNSDRFISALL